MQEIDFSSYNGSANENENKYVGSIEETLLPGHFAPVRKLKVSGSSLDSVCVKFTLPFNSFPSDCQGTHIFCGTWKTWFACKLLPFRLKHFCHSFQFLPFSLQKMRGGKSYLSDTPSSYKIKQHCSGSGKMCFFETCQAANKRSIELEMPERCAV